MSQKNKYLILVFFGIILQVCAQGQETNTKQYNELQSPSGINTYDNKGRRDPFFTLVSQDGRILELEKPYYLEGKLCLQGIIYDPGGASYAVINGQILKKEDEINDCHILEIRPQKVIYSNDGQIFEAALEKDK